MTTGSALALGTVLAMLSETGRARHQAAVATFSRIAVGGLGRLEALHFVKTAMHSVDQVGVYLSSEAGSPHAAGGICRCSPSRWTGFNRFRVCTGFRAGDVFGEYIAVASVWLEDISGDQYSSKRWGLVMCTMQVEDSNARRRIEALNFGWRIYYGVAYTRSPDRKDLLDYISTITIVPF